MSKLPKKLKLEDAMTRLDEIVEALESGTIGIEESIARYEDAMQLAAHCRRILDHAEQRIRKIQIDAAGEVRSEPFSDSERAAAGNDSSEP